MIRIALLGYGYWGPNLLRNFHENPRCELVACCDLDEKKLAKVRARYPSVHVTADPAVVLGDPSIQAVAIATPISTHYAVARRALEAGKHLFVEKPFTASASEARELIDLARARGLLLMVGHTFEYSPAVLKIGEIVKSGHLGKIFYVSMTRVNLGLHQKDVSVIWDLAPHDFSILFHVLGEKPAKVSALGRACIQKGIPDVAFINLEFPSGVVAHLEVSWLSPSKLRSVFIVGSSRMLIWDDTQTVEKVKIFDHGVNYKDPETFGEYHLSYRTGDVVSPKIETYEPLYAELDHFLTCVETGSRPRTDGESGLRVVEALELAEESLRASLR
ncbi:MAG: Gfo/Idh/MocA family oxidoreductase [Planctomycetes bacterium]|nr:Gfo/Idh/MocA family oxidoreductase [Planctomycetota bacterium]